MMILTYLFVLFKQWLAFSLLSIFIQTIFHFVSWTILFQVIVIASILSIFHISISLLLSDWVRSPNGIGYTAFNMITLLILLFPFALCLRSFGWLFIAGLALGSALLFLLGLCRFAKTEMDFVGPEISA